MTNPLNEKDYVTFARRFVKETVETLDYQELKNLVTDYIHEDLQRSYDDYGQVSDTPTGTFSALMRTNFN